METQQPWDGSPGSRLFSIQEVAQMLSLRPATLRAWERRFGVPSPRRAANGYRLYSRADVAVLRQLIARLDGGASIGHAVESLRPEPAPALDVDGLRYRLAEALLKLDERQATIALREALALHPVETVLTQVVEPMMVWIGDAWRAGQISVGVEHFASGVFVRQLVALHLAAPEPWRPGRILAACAPGEHHEIGLLALTVGLRRRGWDVVYLGANLPYAELESAAAAHRPSVVLVSVTSPLNEGELAVLSDVACRLNSTQASVVLGGLAVRGRQAELKPTPIMDGTLPEVLSGLETILVGKG